MSDPSFDLQVALVAALKDGSIPDVGQRIYDVPPKAKAFPYLQVGEGQTLPDKAGCIDGAEVFTQVDVWSREVGFPQAKRIASAVVSVLDDHPPDIDGYDVIVFEHVSTQYMRDPDGLTFHAAITFRSLIYPA